MMTGGLHSFTLKPLEHSHKLNNMLTVSTWLVPLALFFICVPAACAQQHNGTNCEPDRDTCKTHKLSAALGTSVLLPCNFSKNPPNTVSWVQTPEINVVTLSSDGHINFSDPRYGRVNAFPNQGSRKNYSISIDKINSSDLGCYRCLGGEYCVQVELALKMETDNENISLLYISICSGLAVFILLSFGCFFFVRCINDGHRRTDENDIVSSTHEVSDGVSFPTEETGRVPGDGQQEGSYENVVYDNDVEEPDYLNELPQGCGINRNEANPSFVRMESLKTKQRFHAELFNRLRQASVRRHYYVNQDELHKQQDTVSTRGAEKKKTKTTCQYPNPIYNRSTDHLDQL